MLQQGTRLKGASAIIEKDATAARLGQMLNAEAVLFLTKRECLTIHRDTPEETPLREITAAEAASYMEQGHFEPGLDLAKMEAAVEFVTSGENRRAVITTLEKASAGMKGRAGTIIRA